MSVYRSPHVIIDRIIDVLFVAEHRRLAKFITAMVDMNQEAHGRLLDGFHYEGIHYRREGLKGALTKAVLHPSLEPQMDAHLLDRATVKNDEQQIRQTLFKLLDPCRSEQDIRDTLPNCLTDTLGDTARLARRNEPAFTIRDDARALRQYHKVLPRIELYSAARLLY